jgi:hypothetical protein
MEIGDIVTTARHDYKMVIGEINGEMCLCHYFDEHQELHKEQHTINSLTVIS